MHSASSAYIMDTVHILNKLIEKQNLTSHETHLFLSEVMKGNITPAQTAGILVALRMKGETTDEIFGFIKAMRENMLKVDLKNAVDVCGTGGDGSGSFNISTTVAFVVAGAGVKVAKHGNRAASSNCGTADVLEALGVNIQLSPEQTKKVFEKTGMVFLFAPLFHPATKNVVLVRKELKVRTIFNFLGPFSNPAGVKKQIIGVPSVEIAKKLIQVAKKLDYKHLLIITSEDGMDEINISKKTHVFELKNNRVSQFIIDPSKYGFKKSAKKEIMGGASSENAEFIKEILNGTKNPRRDIVVLNSAAALYAADRASNLKDGIVLAEQSIDSGAAKKVLQNLIKETQSYG